MSHEWPGWGWTEENWKGWEEDKPKEDIVGEKSRPVKVFDKYIIDYTRNITSLPGVAETALNGLTSSNFKDLSSIVDSVAAGARETQWGWRTMAGFTGHDYTLVRRSEWVRAGGRLENEFGEESP